jgi:hypothetical protein
VTLGVLQQTVGSGDGDVGLEWWLVWVPPPLALDPHVAAGTRGVGQEKVAKSMPPRSLNSHQHQEA